jgi:hypothetical protein
LVSSSTVVNNNPTAPGGGGDGSPIGNTSGGTTILVTNSGTGGGLELGGGTTADGGNSGGSITTPAVGGTVSISTTTPSSTGVTVTGPVQGTDRVGSTTAGSGAVPATTTTVGGNATGFSGIPSGPGRIAVGGVSPTGSNLVGSVAFNLSNLAPVGGQASTDPTQVAAGDLLAVVATDRDPETAAAGEVSGEIPGLIAPFAGSAGPAALEVPVPVLDGVDDAVEVLAGETQAVVDVADLVLPASRLLTHFLPFDPGAWQESVQTVLDRLQGNVEALLAQLPTRPGFWSWVLVGAAATTTVYTVACQWRDQSRRALVPGGMEGDSVWFVGLIDPGFQDEP